MVTKEFVTLTLIIAFVISIIIILLYIHWLRKNNDCIVDDETSDILESHFSNSKIDTSDIKIISK